MNIVWDERKRLANIAKHGFDFEDVSMAFFEAAVIVPAKLNRMKAIARWGNGIVTVVFFRLGRQGLSLISMRPADRNERKLVA